MRKPKPKPQDNSLHHRIAVVIDPVAWSAKSNVGMAPGTIRKRRQKSEDRAADVIKIISSWPVQESASP